MANEAVLVYETEMAVPININQANALEKGSILQLADGFIGSISTGADELFGGITKVEKVAGDGQSKVAVYFGGIFKMVVGTNGCTVGKACALDDAVNTITDSTANDNDLGRSIGKNLETGTSGDTILVFVGKGY